ncbi:nucleotide pyrophosphohydrolase [Butyrivibrio sp. NC2002]|uniref:nucleotide pyrophosphohydrolase n=1 Tax=Butyrivibrio sp. NC2002 TaxID=1410610 RepID=UPI0005688CCE|nr:nucleotide pyrophosphohydrolase [Butyrivibrio sp. NC2002]
MSFEETCERIAKFTEDRDWDQFHSPENLAKSIAIEAGELLECFQWSSEADDEALREELADVMNYCIQLAQKKGYDICEILNDKIDKNEKKYPVDKSRGSSKKYDQLG